MPKSLFVFILFVPVNNLSVMSGRVFLCLPSTKYRIRCYDQGHNAVNPLAVDFQLSTLRPQM